ncbi:NADH-quinone oxidoreductase subunit A [bacterium]|nr:NADH-quinone oxidoreductase subunit A [bacterium]
MEGLGAYSTIAVALGVAIFCLAAGVYISWLFRPMNPTPIKLEPYECGEPTVGTARVQFRGMFYLVALLFVIFDVEIIFLFPWAVAFRQLGLFAFIEMLIFVTILLFGLLYAWRKGALKWQ